MGSMGKDRDEPFAEVREPFDSTLIWLHRLGVEAHAFGVVFGDELYHWVDAFVGHAFRHAQRVCHGEQRVSIPIVFQRPKHSFHGVIFAVIGWVAGEFDRYLVVRAELDEALEPLRARRVVFRAVVRIDNKGMWRMTVFFNPGQSSLRRSAMKSAVTLPVLK